MMQVIHASSRSLMHPITLVPISVPPGAWDLASYTYSYSSLGSFSNHQPE